MSRGGGRFLGPGPRTSPWAFWALGMYLDYREAGFPQKSFPASPRWTMDELLGVGGTPVPAGSKGGWMLGWEWMSLLWGQVSALGDTETWGLIIVHLVLPFTTFENGEISGLQVPGWVMPPACFPHDPLRNWGAPSAPGGTTSAACGLPASWPLSTVTWRLVCSPPCEWDDAQRRSGTGCRSHSGQRWSQLQNQALIARSRVSRRPVDRRAPGSARYPSLPGGLGSVPPEPSRPAGRWRCGLRQDSRRGTRGAGRRGVPADPGLPGPQPSGAQTAGRGEGASASHRPGPWHTPARGLQPGPLGEEAAATAPERTGLTQGPAAQPLPCYPGRFSLPASMPTPAL